MRSPAAVIERADAAVFIAIENLVAGLPGDPKFAAQARHLLALEQAGHNPEPLVHDVTLLPRHAPSSEGAKVSPMCPEYGVTYLSGRTSRKSQIPSCKFQNLINRWKGDPFPQRRRSSQCTILRLVARIIRWSRMPSAPRIINAAKTPATSVTACACTMVTPMPRWAPRNSATMVPSSAQTAAISSPAKMKGAAEGSLTRA